MSNTTRSAASEEAVGRVHAKINRIYEIAGDAILSKLESSDPDEVAEGMAMCSPAMLTSMTGWVKHNSVTALPDSIEKVSKNSVALKEKKRRGAAKLQLLDPTGTK